MDLIEESFHRLFPNKEFTYQSELEYNRRLSDFNSNIRFTPSSIKVNLNLQWKDIDPEIKIGLVQNLLLKMFKTRAQTYNIELYNNFIKNIPILTPKTRSDPLLEASFQRANRLLPEAVEQPNLVWGTDSFRKLASYNFHNDTIVVSTLFEAASPEMLDYLMYHELLHKYHKFSHNYGRSSFHSRAFREDERRYPDQDKIEREIGSFVRKQRIKGKKASFWNLFQ